MSEAQWNDTWGAAYADGLEANSTTVLCGSQVKRLLSDFQVVYNGGGTLNLPGDRGGTSGVESTQVRVNQAMDSRSVAMDYYQSVHGTVEIGLDRYMEDATTKTYRDKFTSSTEIIVTPNTCFMGFDRAAVSIPMLHPYFQTPLAKTVDADQGGVGVEFGLRVGNPRATIGGINVLGRAA